MRRLIEAARGRTARLAGLVASLVALAAFGFAAAQMVAAENVSELFQNHWDAIFAALILYGLAYVPMTRAWIVLAKGCGAKAGGAELSHIFLVSQIGKYLPGNVAQFLGRAAMGHSRGIALKTLGAAMALELAGVLAACSLLAAAAFGFGLVEPAAAPATRFAVGLAAAAALAGAMLIVRSQSAVGFVRPLVIAILLYLILLILLAAANVLLVGAISGQWNWAMAGAVAGALVVSWLVGFVTPGSPAGLGLREVTFYALLAGSMTGETVVLAAAAFRLVTVAGDILAWLAGLLIAAPMVQRRRLAA